MINQNENGVLETMMNPWGNPERATSQSWSCEEVKVKSNHVHEVSVTFSENYSH